MRLHANAALSLTQRRRMARLVVEDRWSIAAAAAEFNTSQKTCWKWVARYREASEAGLLDRSSAPGRVANRTPQRRVETIKALRRLRFTGPEIAELLDMPLSTVSGILTRIGLGKLGRLGLEPAKRYDRARPGDLIHVDEAMAGYIDSPEFDELLVRTVTRAFPAREHERFVAHYRGLLAAWVRDQR